MRTEWIPTEKVPVYKQEGSDVFRDLVEAHALNANRLSTLSKVKLIEVLKLLVQRYDLWIDLESQKIVNVQQKQ